MRARLFLRWFNKFAESKDFVIKTAEVKSEEESDYVTLIIQKSHPSFDDIIGKHPTPILVLCAIVPTFVPLILKKENDGNK